MRGPMDWKAHWKRVREKNTRGNEIAVKRVQSRLQVIVPPNMHFVAEAYTLGGRWRERTAMWTFPIYKYYGVRELIKKVYSRDIPQFHDLERTHAQSTKNG